MNPQLAPNPNVVGYTRDKTCDNKINIAYINCYGKSKFLIDKQLEIQSYVCTNKLDIIHLQECRIEEDTFAQCGFLTSNSYFGTASIVRSDLPVSNIHTDNEGRVLIFDAAQCTWGNF